MPGKKIASKPLLSGALVASTLGWGALPAKASLITSISYSQAINDGLDSTYVTGSSLPLNTSNTNSALSYSASANYSFTDNGAAVVFRIDDQLAITSGGFHGEGTVEEYSNPQPITFTVSRPVMLQISMGLTTVSGKGVASVDYSVKNTNPAEYMEDANQQQLLENTNPSPSTTFSELLSGIGTYEFAEAVSIANNFTDNTGEPISGNGYYQATLTALAEATTWGTSGGGSWSAGGNWANNIIPQFANDTATFGSSILAPSTVTLDGNWTVANINFNNTNSYTIAPGSGGNLTLDNGGNSADITDSLGTHFISANLILNSNTVINVTNATDSLNISGNISGSGGLTIAGAGKVAISGSGNAISSLAINSGSTLDITNSSLLIQYGSNPDPTSTIRSYLSSGYNDGVWTGTGLNSSTAASTSGKFAIGYLDGSDNGGTAGQLLLQYALVGDANLDGTVNLTDLLALLNNYGQTGKDWSEGDFNYDGTVNLTDLLALLNNYGQSANLTGLSSTQVVPEPATVSLLTLGFATFLPRRRTSQTRIAHR
jgi:hypothetical protein